MRDTKASQPHEINIDGENCTVWVQQKSKTVWSAHGSFHGKQYYGKGGTESAAIADWLYHVENRDS